LNKPLKYLPPDKILASYAEILAYFALQHRKQNTKKSIVECSLPLNAEYMIPFLDHATRLKEAKATFKVGDTSVSEIGTGTYFCEIKMVDPAQENTFFHSSSKDVMINWEKDMIPWTKGIVGSNEAARRIGMSTEMFWMEIIKASHLDKKNPLMEWKRICEEVKRKAEDLTSLHIEKMYVNGSGIDIECVIGKNRKWLGGRGKNIPSYEVFTSPVWSSVSGSIQFDLPIFIEENEISDIQLEFKDGVVIYASAKKNQQLLQRILQEEGMNKVGEVSLTDKRSSPINHPLAITLIDENLGGENGNFHLALGKSFPTAYKSETNSVTDSDLYTHGFNASNYHIDLITTRPLTVLVDLHHQEKRKLYSEGCFYELL